MKKAFLLALAAFAVSAAQAVTCTWASNNGTAAYWGGNYNWGTGSGTHASFILSSTASLVTSTASISSDFPATGTVTLSSITIAQRSGTNNDIASIVIMGSDGSSYTATSVTSVSNGIRTTDTNGDYWTRGAYSITFTDTTVDVNVTYSIYAYDSDGNEVALTSSVVSDDNSTWLPSMIISGSYEVPEPTVLALLALGVAGIALKRKVA